MRCMKERQTRDRKKLNHFFKLTIKASQSYIDIHGNHPVHEHERTSRRKCTVRPAELTTLDMLRHGENLNYAMHVSWELSCCASRKTEVPKSFSPEEEERSLSPFSQSLCGTFTCYVQEAGKTLDQGTGVTKLKYIQWGENMALKRYTVFLHQFLVATSSRTFKKKWIKLLLWINS